MIPSGRIFRFYPVLESRQLSGRTEMKTLVSPKHESLDKIIIDPTEIESVRSAKSIGQMTIKEIGTTSITVPPSSANPPRSSATATKNNPRPNSTISS